MNSKIIIMIIIILIGLFWIIYKIDAFTPAVITQLTARGGMDEKLIGMSHHRMCVDPLFALDLPLKKSQEPIVRC
jgi:hypothetical protein